MLQILSQSFLVAAKLEGWGRDRSLPTDVRDGWDHNPHEIRLRVDRFRGVGLRPRD